MTSTDSGSEASDPRARWRKLPPEPTEWIEEVDREPSAVDYGPGRDSSGDIPTYGAGYANP